MRAKLDGISKGRLSMNEIKLLRNVVPNKYRDTIVSFATYLTPVKAKCEFTNIYHCCVYKTGSQWIRRIFSDPRVYRWTGLKPINGARLCCDFNLKIPVRGRRKSEGFSPNTAVTGMYISYDNFVQTQKPDNYAAFFIIRDPRELVVSWYFSTRYTHPENPGVLKLRGQMAGMSDKTGIIFSIDHWKTTGLFDVLLQWYRAGQKDDRVKLFSFEDLTGDNGYAHFKGIFVHCGISIPDNTFQKVYASHSAKNIVSKKNTDKYASALKKGKMKWPGYFDREVTDFFLNVEPLLVDELGYSW
jgi:hypothetical protein